MKRVLVIAAIVIAVLVGVKAFALFGPVVNYAGSYEPKEGDIIFQETHGRQSPMIKAATMSRWTHCGVVVMKDGKPHVVEAWKTCQVIPMKDWIARDKGVYAIVRPKAFEGKKIKVNYSKYLGKPYDLQFRFNNGKVYCSELAWLIYKDITGEELSEPKPMKSYLLTHVSDKIKNEIKKSGMKMDDPMVAPVDLMESSKVRRIY